MIPRYARPDAVAIWSPETRYKIWFEIEAHAADAMAELGTIPKAAAEAIWAGGKDAVGAIVVAVSQDGNEVSVEVRDKARPEYGVITLVFTRKGEAPGGLELSSWAALDSQKRRTIVTLSNQQYGLAVADNAFRLNDPRAPVRR